MCSLPPVEPRLILAPEEEIVIVGKVLIGVVGLKFDTCLFVEIGVLPFEIGASTRLIGGGLIRNRPVCVCVCV